MVMAYSYMPLPSKQVGVRNVFFLNGSTKFSTTVSEFILEDYSNI